MGLFKKSGGTSIRERILAKSSRSLSWNRTVLAMLIMGCIALTAIFLLFQMTAQVMAKNVRLSLEQTVEQQRIHFDFRLRSVQQQAENLMTTIYPYMSGSEDPLEQYQEFEQLKSAISPAPAIRISPVSGCTSPATKSTAARAKPSCHCSS